MRSKRRPAVQWFRQSVAPYSKDLFVCTGFKTMAEVKRKTGKCEKWWTEFLDGKADVFDKLASGEEFAFVMTHPKRGSAVIRLRPYADYWEFWETLIHELHHYVDQLSEQLAFGDELEAKAYLQEHLFHTIRRRLMGLDK